MSGCICHIDMDAFFAAIEQLDHPEYRGKPVIVGADPKEGVGRGVVSTCSYEARIYGIRSAMPISKAYRLCPSAIYVAPRGRRYVDMSKKIMATLHDFSPDIEQISIDEAFLDITSTAKFYGSSAKLGRALKETIKREAQLTASVGIAPNKFVAKIASDLEKPDGLVIVPSEEVVQFLSPLSISRLWGVGDKTLPRLQQLGIRTIGDLARFSQMELIDRFGKSGLHFWHLANGHDPRKIEGEIHAKSMSKEVTFEHDIDDDEELRSVLLYLCHELSHDLRRKGYRGKTLTLKIRLEDFSTFTRSRSFVEPTNHSVVIYNSVIDLYDYFPREGARIRLLGVGLSHLERGESQLNLFESDDRLDNRLDDVIDSVREKFGKNAITRASLLKSRHKSQWFRDD